VVDHLRAAGRNVGCVAVTSFRPFPAAELARALGHARAVAVVERTDEPAAADNPLTREVKAALFDQAADGAVVPRVRSVSAGLGSRDVAPGDIAAVYDWLAGRRPNGDRHYATLGIRHPLALAADTLDLRPPGSFSVRGHSIGGFGSVTTNKLVASLIGGAFGLHVQAYPRYGSEKKGLPTTYFMTAAPERIRQHGELEHVDFVPLHDVAAFRQGRPLQGLEDGGTVFVPSSLADPAAIWASVPEDARREMLSRRIRLVALDTAALATRWSPRPELVTRMQGVALVGVFLRLTPFAERAGMDRDALLGALRPELERFFGKRGSAVVDANLGLVRDAYDGVLDVTAGVTALMPAPAMELELVEVA
jgi:pyruvate-ferredoxin/flavodoxin oxidoreductase